MHNATKATFILLLTLTVLAGARTNPSAVDKFVKPKSAKTMSEKAVRYFAQNSINGTVKAWIFFTDKGFQARAGFMAAKKKAADLLSKRSLWRRARNGKHDLQFTDLPVNQTYLDAVKQKVVKLRRVSRWLNAVSVEVGLEELDFISRLSFVEKIQPVAIYKRQPVPAEQSDKIEIDRTRLATHALDYGLSFGQLDQINVPICHDSGYTGSGVIVAVFDTGFRKSHISFAQAYSEGRVLDEYDYVFDDGNVANEPEDWSSAWSHGTSTWSTTGGYNPGQHLGPAFGASFLIYKTEDIRSETQVEEDNWVAAIERAELLGADVVTSSLSYSSWYTSSDYNGDICVTTIAADIAAANGIVVCNSAGNSGPSASTLGAPADADSILTVGAVNSSGIIASFSSRGPTADGRTKPEVCAQGVSVRVASSGSTTSYTYSSGTSFSCPLTAGVAALVIGAHPNWTAMQVREAMMMTADNAGSPNNTYGWGILDAWAAIQYSFTPAFTRGDANASGLINVTDAVYIVNYIFNSGPEPVPVLDAGDADSSGEVNISDAVFLIDYIFNGGSAPAP